MVARDGERPDCRFELRYNLYEVARVSAAITVSSITKMVNVEHLIPIRTLLIIRRNINEL